MDPDSRLTGDLGDDGDDDDDGDGDDDGDDDGGPGPFWDGQYVLF